LNGQRLGESFLSPTAPARKLAYIPDSSGGSSGSDSSDWFNSTDSTNSSLASLGVGGTASTATGAASGGSALIQILITLCCSCIYKMKVVDPMGKFPDAPPAGPSEGYDDFAFGLCDCLMNPHMCFFMCCCSPLRLAHTNEVAGICMGFWSSLISWFCCAMCCSQFLGPLCLNVYWRYQLKEKMAIKTGFMDCLVAFCPCTMYCAIGQQALQADDAMGFKYTCPCSAAPADVPLE